MPRKLLVPESTEESPSTNKAGTGGPERGNAEAAGAGAGGGEELTAWSGDRTAAGAGVSCGSAERELMRERLKKRRSGKWIDIVRTRKSRGEGGGGSSGG